MKARTKDVENGTAPKNAGCFRSVVGVGLGLALGAGYVSRRHALPPLLPALGYAAVGVPIVGGFVLDLVGGRRPGPWPADERAPRAAVLLGFAILALFALPRDLRERRSGRLAERQAAEWLRDQPHTSGAVAAGQLRHTMALTLSAEESASPRMPGPLPVTEK